MTRPRITRTDAQLLTWATPLAGFAFAILYVGLGR